MPMGEHNDQPDGLVILVSNFFVVELVPFIKGLDIFFTKSN